MEEICIFFKKYNIIGYVYFMKIRVNCPTFIGHIISTISFIGFSHVFVYAVICF